MMVTCDSYTARVEGFILENGLIEENGSVLVGLSGGADSVALLTLLKSLSQRHGWRVGAAHFNHGIRGAQADEDERFCREYCVKLGVPFFSEKADVPAYAAENGLSLETAGRLLRYDFLEMIRREKGFDRVAVAHHMDDNAESVLLHILRGSGLAGLTGIKPVRGLIIRPLLCMRRSDIEGYLAELGIPFRTDRTNLVPEGSRNRVRLELLPYVQEHINSCVVGTLCSMAELLSKDEDHLMGEAKKAYASMKKDGGLKRFEAAKLAYPIKVRVIRLALQDADALVDIERVHIEAIIELLTAKTGARLCLPHIEAWTSYELLKFGKPRKAEDFELPLTEGNIETPLGTLKVNFVKGQKGFVRSADVCFIDRDKAVALGAPLVIRARREGDKIRPVGAAGHKKLKDFFIDRKVERGTRAVLPLIAAGSEVLYAAGLASSETVKVDCGTREMIRAEFIRRPCEE